MHHGLQTHTHTHTQDNNKKCILSSKSAYQNCFWRIIWHRRLEYEAEHSALSSQE